MSVMETLVTDRTQDHVRRLNYLDSKGWEHMTVAEQHEWMYGNDDIYWADGEAIVCLDGAVLIDGVSNKGAYNAIDLNRVNEAMEYLADRLNRFGFMVSLLPTPVWTVDDIPTVEQMNDYLGNLRTLRNVYETFKSAAPIPDDMDYLTTEEANNIERFLTEIDGIIDRVFRSFRRSGQFTFWSGTLPLPVL